MSCSASKTPVEIKDYSFDWTDSLNDGETITSSVWSASPSDLNVNTPLPTVSGAITQVWLSGGTAGKSYAVDNVIRTSGGRTFQKDFLCFVNENSYVEC